MKFKSFLTGATIGFAVTLLTTKRSGKENIQIAKNLISEITNDINTFNKQKNDITHKLQEVQNLTSTLLPDTIDGVKKDIKNFQFQIEPRIQKLQEEIEKFKKDLQN